MVAKIGCARQRASVESVRIAGGGGQPHDDAGPTGAAVDLDLAPMPLDQPLGHREAALELPTHDGERGPDDPAQIRRLALVLRPVGHGEQSRDRVLDALYRVA
jgi:hypothetical protein